MCRRARWRPCTASTGGGGKGGGKGGGEARRAVPARVGLRVGLGGAADGHEVPATVRSARGQRRRRPRVRRGSGGGSRPRCYGALSGLAEPGVPDSTSRLRRRGELPCPVGRPRSGRRAIRAAASAASTRAVLRTALAHRMRRRRSRACDRARRRRSGARVIARRSNGLDRAWRFSSSRRVAAPRRRDGRGRLSPVGRHGRMATRRVRRARGRYCVLGRPGRRRDDPRGEGGTRSRNSAVAVGAPTPPRRRGASTRLQPLAVDLADAVTPVDTRRWQRMCAHACERCTPVPARPSARRTRRFSGFDSCGWPHCVERRRPGRDSRPWSCRRRRRSTRPEAPCPAVAQAMHRAVLAAAPRRGATRASAAACARALIGVRAALARARRVAGAGLGGRRRQHRARRHRRDHGVRSTAPRRRPLGKGGAGGVA